MNSNPIGVFDSGIGGLTIAKEIVKQLPNESIIYLGDTARVPYGPRSKEIITKFALELTNFLLKRGVKALVVACNTISANSLEEIKKASSVPVIGVVDPAIEAALKATKNKHIGIIGTTGTINSHAYENQIKQLDPEVRVSSIACPLFVPIAEEGFGEHESTKLIAKEYLAEIKSLRIDTLILGCTHYPLLEKVIRQTVGESVTLVDSAKPTAKQLKNLLEEKGLESNSQNQTLEFYVTDAPERVYRVAGSFFGEQLNGKLKKVDLSVSFPDNLRTY